MVEFVCSLTIRSMYSHEKEIEMKKNDLQEEMRRRVRINSMREHSSKLELLVGKVVFNHHTTLTPFSKDLHFTFCHLTEISLGVERVFSTNFKTVYLGQWRAGLIRSLDRYRLNESLESDQVTMDFECGRNSGVLGPYEGNENIYTFSYTKEHLEKNVNLSLFYLEELSFQWIDSFHDDILSFTLVEK